MANRNLTVEKAEAKKFYLRGIKSPVMLAKILDLPRQTVAAWIEREGWANIAEVNDVTVLDIVQEVTKVLSMLLKEAKEMHESGELPSMQTTKTILFYTRALRQLDEDYDVRGSLLFWSNKYINFVSAADQSLIPDKKSFVKALQSTLPLFLKSQDQ